MEGGSVCPGALLKTSYSLKTQWKATKGLGSMSGPDRCFKDIAQSGYCVQKAPESREARSREARLGALDAGAGRVVAGRGPSASTLLHRPNRVTHRLRCPQS